MSFKYRIRLAGAGSHGLIDSARILAEAAAIYEDLFAAESCSIGPEARGSTCRADITVSDEVIEDPGSGSSDLLVVLNRESFEAYADSLRPGGLLVAEGSAVADLTGNSIKIRTFSLPGLKEPAVRMRHTEMVVLGLVSGACDVIGERAIRKAIVARSPKTLEKTCIEAFETGLSLLSEGERHCPGAAGESEQG